MAIKHFRIRPVRAVTGSYLDIDAPPGVGEVFTEGSAIQFDVTQAPGVFIEPASNTPVINGLVGFTSMPASSASAGTPVRVSGAYPGRRFIGSLTNTTAVGGADDGSKKIGFSANTRLGDELALIKDNGTGRWVFSANGGLLGSQFFRIVRHIDPIQSTTNDIPNFGSGNSGFALVEVICNVNATIFGD